MTRPTRPDVDLAALAAYTAGVTRAVTEYRVLPAAPPGHIAAPCVTGCGRTARTTRGVCRDCMRLASALEPREAEDAR